MAFHRVFYDTLKEAEEAATWIEENIISAENVNVHEASDGSNDEVSFETPRKLSEFDQSVIVYGTGAMCFSFNSEL
jgi:hypothetical protein